MKWSSFRIGTTLMILGHLLFAANASGDSESVQQIYATAKKHSIDQDWDKALLLFQMITNDLPVNDYRDEAQFWIGYCLEKKGTSDLEAFMAYEFVRERYPNSPWVDDAVVHQILLSERLVRRGNDQFSGFLMEKLDDPVESVRQQAAAALGRLSTERPSDPLAGGRNSEDPYAHGRSEGNQIRVASPPETGDQASIFSVGEQAKIRADVPYDDRLIFTTRRHKQYQRMLRTEGAWSREELIDFGLWTILPTQQFEALAVLDGYDREEWLRKFWKSRDPTPTTEENEIQQEFDRRVSFACAHFSESWSYLQMPRLREQYIRDGWPHAPWDARGELYIKYGEPSYRVPLDNLKEEWSYRNYGVDFYVYSHMTNIYGNALELGPMSIDKYSHDPTYVEKNFIFKPEFRYAHDYGARPMKNVTCTTEAKPETTEVVIHYSIPVRELRITKLTDGHGVRYLERIVLYDQDLREVRRLETLRTHTKQSRWGLAREKTIEETVPVDLQPGRYSVALRIEDQHSDKLAIIIDHVTKQ